MKRKLIHLPLEPYKARYTEMLHRWEKDAFSSQFDVETIDPAPSSGIPMDILSGEVLDQTQRPLYGLSQVSTLLSSLSKQGPFNRQTVWFSDFYTPGIDALLYSGVLKDSVKACFLWAQTFDVHDFTHKRHWPWMRCYEQMAFEFYDLVFVASPLLAEFIQASLGPSVSSKLVVCPSLPFSTKDVTNTYLSGLTNSGVPAERDIDVVFTSRLDEEKCPGFFAEIIERLPDYRFALCSGHPDMKGTATKAIARLKALREAGRLTIFTGLSKPEYYRVLARSKVQFNCAKQDWVSFTLLEALTMGCRPCYPMTRSFPEVIPSELGMYAAGVRAAAVNHLEYLLEDYSILDTVSAAMREHVLREADSTLPFITETLFKA